MSETAHRGADIDEVVDLVSDDDEDSPESNGRASSIGDADGLVIYAASSVSSKRNIERVHGALGTRGTQSGFDASSTENVATGTMPSTSMPVVSHSMAPSLMQGGEVSQSDAGSVSTGRKRGRHEQAGGECYLEADDNKRQRRAKRRRVEAGRSTGVGEFTCEVCGKTLSSMVYLR